MSIPTAETIPSSKYRWPTSMMGWAGLLCLVAADIWLIYTRQDAVVLILTGYIFNQIGMDAKQSATLTTVVAAVSHSARVADVAVEAATKADEKLSAIDERIKDIQDNPAMPGTPNWPNSQGKNQL